MMPGQGVRQLALTPRRFAGTVNFTVAAAYAVLAWWVFERGLGRYASGSRFGVRD
jgi:hypothetical protein